MSFRRSQAFYTVEKTATMTGIPKSDIERYISLGEISAAYMDNLGAYIIRLPDLVRFLKKQKKWPLIRKIIGSRILVADRDLKIQEIIRADLNRAGVVEVRVATTEQEIKRDVEDFLPEIIVVPMEAFLRQTDSIGSSILQAKEECQSRIILYFKGMVPPELSDAAKQLVDSLQADETFSISTGVNVLTSTLRKHLGLR